MTFRRHLWPGTKCWTKLQNKRRFHISSCRSPRDKQNVMLDWENEKKYCFVDRITDEKQVKFWWRPQNEIYEVFWFYYRNTKVSSLQAAAAPKWQFLVSFFCHIGTLLNRYDTDSPLWVLLMASAKMVEMSITCKQNQLKWFRGSMNDWHKCDNLTLILLQLVRCSSWGIVFVTTTASKQAFSIFSKALPEKMPCVNMA